MPKFCRILAILSLLMAAVISGCGKPEDYKAIALSDPALAEFNDALSVDRAKLGLPSLPDFADVAVERSNGSTYDAMLHVYAKHQSRTIAFRNQNGIMKWIGEQVIVDGPQPYTTVDGTFQEQICLNYDTSRISGAPINQLDIRYSGPNPKLNGISNLNSDDVATYLSLWLAAP